MKGNARLRPVLLIGIIAFALCASRWAQAQEAQGPTIAMDTIKAQITEDTCRSFERGCANGVHKLMPSLAQGREWETVF